MSNDERRRYFRINDTMGIAFHHIGKKEADSLAEQIMTKSGVVDYAANFDNRIHTLLDSCRLQSPIAAELIDLVNRKLNFVIHQMELDTNLMQKVAYNVKQVNVSACGLAFFEDQELECGQLLHIDILLHPGELHVAAIAKVVDCHKAMNEVENREQFLVRLDYEYIHEHDQELLIQHIVKQQSVQLKKQRMQRMHLE